MSTGIEGARSGAVAGDSVGWTDGIRFAQAPIAGGAVAEYVAVPNTATTGAIASDGATFYFTRQTRRSMLLRQAKAASARSRTLSVCLPTRHISSARASLRRTGVLRGWNRGGATPIRRTAPQSSYVFVSP